MELMGTCRGNLAYLAIASALLASATAAQADSVAVTAKFATSQPNTLQVNLTSDYIGGYNSHGTTVSTIAGIYNFTNVSVASNSGPSTALTVSQVQAALGTGFGAVCIDFTHNITYGQTVTWQVENLTGVTAATNGVGISTTQANAIAWLWGNFGPTGSAWHSLPATTAEQDAVFQMAVWDLIYDGAAYNPTFHPAPYVSYGYQHSSSYIDSSDVTSAANWAALAWSNNEQLRRRAAGLCLGLHERLKASISPSSPVRTTPSRSPYPPPSGSPLVCSAYSERCSPYGSAQPQPTDL